MVTDKADRDPRQNFMATEGFILYNDAINQVMDELGDKPLPTPKDCNELIETEWVGRDAGINDCFASSAGLYVVSKLLASQARIKKDTSATSRVEHFNLNQKEREQVYEYTYFDGLDELDFTWIFSSALASAAMQSFVKADVISLDEANNLQLPDWADVIASDWFGRLNRTFAHTGFGAYGGDRRFGDRVSDHGPGALEEWLNARAANKFNVPRQDGGAFAVEPYEKGFHDVKVVATPAFRTLLTGMLLRSSKNGEPDTDDDFGGSIGCPVGRHAAVLPHDYEKYMPRALRLQAMGHLSIAKNPDINGNYPATQEASGIERNLHFIAGQLRDFHDLYGSLQIKLN